MKQRFHHYERWEDFHAGLFALSAHSPEETIELARALLADPEALHDAMSYVTRFWPYSSQVNLTNRSRNRQAWLGQAACCVVHGAPEDFTKLAWHRLTDSQRDAANAVADRVIAAWESRYQEPDCCLRLDLA